VSRKIKRTVASTLALAMMAGNVSSMPAVQFSTVVQVNAAAGATVSVKMADAGQSTTVKPGDEFTVLCDVTDNADGFSALVAWLSYNQDAFEMTSWNYASDNKRDPVRKNMADPTDPDNTSKYENPDKSIGTIVQLYDSTENLTGDTQLSKITFKVKSGAAAGSYKFSLGGDPVPQNGLMTACQNRNVPDGSDTKVIELEPNYVPLSVTVDSDVKPSNPTTAPTTTPTTTPTNNAGQTGSLTGTVADATGSAGGTVSTTLTVSGASIAGFTADLDFDTSALTLSSASASGWDVKVNGKQIVGLADPYQDNTSAAVKLEFKAASSASGSYGVSVASLKGAPKSASSEITGTGTKGTITISGGSTTPTSAPTSSTPVGNGIQIVPMEAKVSKGGEEAEVVISAKNVGSGFSAVQFSYELPSGFVVTDGTSEKGKWTLGQSEKAAQFLEKNGNNIASDCELGELYVKVPEGTAEGAYPIKLSNFKGSKYDESVKKQVSLTSDAFSTVVGYIIVGNASAPTTPTVKPTSAATPTKTPTNPPVDPTSSTPVGDGINVSFKDAKVKAGEEAEISVMVSNAAAGFSAVQFSYDMDASFKITDAISDLGKWTVGKEERAAQFLEKNGNNITKDGELGTIYVEVPAGTPDGKYPVKLTNFKGSKYDESVKKQVTLGSDAFGTTVGYIIVGDVADADPTSTPAPTSTPTPTKTPTNPPVDPTSSTPVGNGIGVAFKDTKVNAGEEAEIDVVITNASAGFSAVQFGYDMDASFKITDAISDLGKWTVGKEERAAQFLEKNGNNITKDGVLGTIYVEVPAGTPDGKYPVKLTNFKGSKYDESVKKQVTLGSDAFSTTVGYIIVGDATDVDPTSTPAPTTPPTAASTAPTPTKTPAASPTPDQNPQKLPEGATVSVKMADTSIKNVKPGDEFTVICDVTNNADGFSALVAWLSYNQDTFEMTAWNYASDNKRDPVRKNMADPTDPDNTSKYENPDKSIGTIVQLYDSTENLTGDVQLSKITFKVKSGAKDGVYSFSLGGDPELQNGLKTADQNRNVKDGDTTKVIELAPKYVPLEVTVGEGSSSVDPTTPPTSATSTPAPTTPPTDATTTPQPGSGIQVSFKDVQVNAGDEAEIDIVISNAADGFSAVQFGYDMDASFKITDAISDLGKWTVGKEERAVQFLEKNGNNITKDGVLGTIYVDIPEGTPDGKYAVTLSGFKGSRYDESAKKQVTLGSDAFSTVVGYITVGKGDTTVDPTTPPTTPTTKPDTGNYDVNGDGSVNTSDIVALKEFLLLVTDKAPKNGDVNGDGKINSNDMINLVKYLLSK